jgi:hypothetical protein
MTIQRICGAECGIKTAPITSQTFTKWREVIGTVGISSTARSGNRSFEFVAAATDPYITARTVASATVTYQRMYFQMSTATPSEATYIACLAFSAAGQNANIGVTTGIAPAANASFSIVIPHGRTVAFTYASGTPTWKWFPV